MLLRMLLQYSEGKDKNIIETYAELYMSVFKQNEIKQKRNRVPIVLRCEACAQG